MTSISAPGPDPGASLSLLLSAHGVWWVLVLDGRTARLLARHGGRDRFEELPGVPTADRDGSPIEPVESGHHHGRYEKTERQFVERIAARLEDHASHSAFDHLAVFAAPTALGVLRPALGTQTAARLRHVEAKDLTRESLANLRHRLTIAQG